MDAETAHVRPFTAELTSRNVVRVDIPFKRSIDWDFKILLRGDAHHDNIHCNQDLEREHLQEALRHGAPILDVGDLFCAMQGKYDPRSDKSTLREEHKVKHYLDALVSTSADFYEKYAHLFIGLGHGNHETSILKRHETDLTQRLAQTLYDRTKVSIPVIGYSGYVWLRFIDGDTRYPILVHFDHGWGGGNAAVTKDVIQSNRRASFIGDADIVVSGHVHERWMLELMRIELNKATGAVEQRSQWHVRVPTYKDEYGDGFEGWHVEKGRPPKPVGAVWLNFSYSRRRQRVLYTLTAAS